MPDRAIIPLLPALSVGFLCGIIASALLLGDGATLALGVAGAALVVLAGGSSVIGGGGKPGEKTIVGVLRAACAVVTFVGVYLFMLGFLREGNVLGGLVWLVLAGVAALILTRLDVRREPRDRGTLQDAR